MNYYSDVHKLGLLSKRIDRLQDTLERIEVLGLSSSSGAGISKTFLDPYKIRLEIDRAIAEYDFISNRLNHGTWQNKQVKKVKFGNGKDI